MINNYFYYSGCLFIIHMIIQLFQKDDNDSKSLSEGVSYEELNVINEKTRNENKKTGFVYINITLGILFFIWSVFGALHSNYEKYLYYVLILIDVFYIISVIKKSIVLAINTVQGKNDNELKIGKAIYRSLFKITTLFIILIIHFLG